jgi:hypothetical protein
MSAIVSSDALVGFERTAAGAGTNSPEGAGTAMMEALGSVVFVGLALIFGVATLEDFLEFLLDVLALPFSFSSRDFNFCLAAEVNFPFLYNLVLMLSLRG